MRLKFLLGLVVLSVLAGLSAGNTSCRVGWTQYGYFCYYAHNGNVNWLQGRSWCQSYGGDIASIIDSSHNSYIKGLLDAFDNHGHIGMNDFYREGTWEWIDQKPVTYTAWNGGEPSGNSGKGHCAGMYYHTGTWDDYQCESTYRAVVCYAPIDATAVSTGCQCPFAPAHYECACCKSGATHCGLANRDECYWNSGYMNSDYCGKAYNRPNNDWQLVFKAVANQNNFAVRDQWVGSGTYYDGDAQAQRIDDHSRHFKSSTANTWPTSTVTQVKIAFFDSGGDERMSLTFKTSGYSRTSFYTRNALLYSQYYDIMSDGLNYWSIDGHGSGCGRHFFISSYYNGCNGDHGWVVVIDYPSGCGCSWETAVTRPSFLYSYDHYSGNWYNGYMERATVMGIFYEIAATAETAKQGTASTENACESGWEYYENGCYYAVTTKRTWYDSLASCRGLSTGTGNEAADLLSVHSSDEAYFAQGVTRYKFVYDHWWIGMNDLNNEGVWEWSNGDSNSYTWWYGSDPNGGIGENCGLLYWQSGGSPSWIDVGCTNSYYYICKYRIGQYKTCQAWKDAGYSTSTYYIIDPDGIRSGQPPFRVYCDMSTGKTKAEHKHSDLRLYIDGANSWANPRSWGSGWLNYYGVSYSQLGALADTSSSCSQYMKYECSGTIIYYTGDMYAVWYDRSQNIRWNWAGADWNYYCPCGVAGTCVDNLRCNCEKNDNVWRYDDGDITDKSSLPVTYIAHGDLDGSSELAYSTLGPMYCSGGSFTYPTLTPATNPLSETSTGCISNWILHDGHCYRLYTTARTWFDALESCRAIDTGSSNGDSDLASVEDNDENYFLLTLSRWTFAQEHYWIGLNDLDEEGDWQWTDGTSVGHTSWYSGQPDNSGNIQDCTFLAWDSTPKWYDDSCTSSRKYICEYKIGGQLSTTAQTNPLVATSGCESNGYLFNGKCYYPTSDKKNYYDAGVVCNNYGGYLTSIENLSEWQYLRKLLRWKQYTDFYFYIGLNDVEEEGTWVEQDGSSHSFTRWESGEPNGAAIGNAVVMRARVNDGCYDVSVESSYQYICEETPGASAISQPSTNSNCPSGWVSNGDYCYLFYTAGTTNSDTARSNCQGTTSADMLEIEDQDEFDWIKLYIRTHYYNRNFYIGLFYDTNAGKYYWVDNEELATSSSFWSAGSPSSPGSENCNYLSADDNLIKDAACSTSYYYICEQDLYISNPVRDVTTKVYGTTTVDVYWEKPLLIDSQNSDIQGYKVYFYIQGEEESTKDSVTVSGKDTVQHTFLTLEPGSTYEMYLTSYNSFGEGPASDPPVEVITLKAQIRTSTQRYSVYEKDDEKRLDGHRLFTQTAHNSVHCINICTSEEKCKSINYNTENGDCEVNESNKRLHPSDLGSDSNYIYWGV